MYNINGYDVYVDAQTLHRQIKNTNITYELHCKVNIIKTIRTYINIPFASTSIAECFNDRSNRRCST